MSIEETRHGTYTEPFTQTQYGGFVRKADGKLYFVAACVSPESAKMKVENYYRSMSKHPQNNMDMTDLDRIVIRARTQTFGVWDEC